MTLFSDAFPVLDWSRANGFSGGGLDRRSDLRGDSAALDEAFAHPDVRLMLFFGDQIWLGGGENPFAYLEGDRARTAVCTNRLFLGLDADDRPWFAGELVSEPVLGEGERLTDLRSLALEGEVSAEVFGPAAQARSMLFWHKRHGFCANCGAPTAIAAGGYQRDCAACGSQHFPRTDPVVIMLITDGDRALLGRQSRFKPGSYSCLAGFMEPGETVEDAVRREVREESAIKVGRVRYHSSQPWPFPSNLMLGCIGEAESQEITIDPNELEDCRWFSRQDVKAMLAGDHPQGLFCPPPLAIARVLIEAWING
ncbi:NAD(+) diphosphatase [Oryzibacter oryziterrae]|uniref:NAD(+) diphosphatase n=1 Tax=Oryzibacter oryziterrae TaxID=2766474 RepID=UPI001F00538B|nr:NAD(+) diphosphatase [Oryzibacter oryziterrae]